ncbi:MAG: hypothetical protein KA715_06415 [Xanthomonadaceae bacterium]|nr:hypothetical protein [Xanthomonadaceae bacterium]
MIKEGILYPNVSRIPAQGDSAASEAKSAKDIKPGEFDRALNDAIKSPSNENIGQIRPGVKFSSHASQRVQERKINVGPELMSKVNDAIDKAAAKGLEESLILTANSAFIVNVKNRTIITAMDKEGMSGNVFTNIDGAVII